MIDPESIEALQSELKSAISGDRRVLDELRADVRPLKDATKPIHPRSTTAISLVGTDGGNNRIEFDPFLVQLVRVVDSSNNEYCLEVVTPTSDRRLVTKRHFAEEGGPRTALGQMMTKLGVKTLWELSPMIPRPPERDGPVDPVSPSWVQVYRELTEWAVLLKLVTELHYGTDTVIVADGNLRSKVFKGELFVKYRELLAHCLGFRPMQRAKHNRTQNNSRVRRAIAYQLAAQPTKLSQYGSVIREVPEVPLGDGQMVRSGVENSLRDAHDVADASSRHFRLGKGDRYRTAVNSYGRQTKQPCSKIRGPSTAKRICHPMSTLCSAPEYPKRELYWKHCVVRAYSI